MTDEERTNRNPKPEVFTVNLDDCPELFIKDLEPRRVYILHGQRASTWNYVGAFPEGGRIIYVFQAPRVSTMCGLIERPDKSGTLEDGRGVKVTIRKYNGPDA